MEIVSAGINDETEGALQLRKSRIGILEGRKEDRKQTGDKQIKIPADKKQMARGHERTMS